MEIVQAIVLGVVQGISEFLPVSSSGHLVLVPAIFGWEDQGVVFDVAVHLATLTAVLYMFWPEVARTTKAFARRPTSEDARLGWMILVATLPAVIVGFFWSKTIEVVFRSPGWVAINLIVWGVVLAVADVWATKRAREPQKGIQVRWRTAIIAGLAQAVALIPGTSRSGITISAGLATGLDRLQAARFSFLLGVPAIAGAGMLTAVQVFSEHSPIDWIPTIVGFFTALIFGILSIRFLLKFVAKTSYVWFALYRAVLAVVIILFFL